MKQIPLIILNTISKKKRDSRDVPKGKLRTTCPFFHIAHLSRYCFSHIFYRNALLILLQVPMAAKYPLPQRWQILRKQFLEASDWFTAYNRGKVFNLW